MVVWPGRIDALAAKPQTIGSERKFGNIAVNIDKYREPPVNNFTEKTRAA
jgi:hypothetical protein